MQVVKGLRSCKPLKSLKWPSICKHLALRSIPRLEFHLNNPWFSKLAVWLVIALVLFTVFKQFDSRGQAGNGYLAYSDFLEEVRGKRIKSATIQEGQGGTEIVAITTDERIVTGGSCERHQEASCSGYGCSGKHIVFRAALQQHGSVEATDERSVERGERRRRDEGYGLDLRGVIDGDRQRSLDLSHEGHAVLDGAQLVEPTSRPNVDVWIELNFTFHRIHLPDPSSLAPAVSRLF